MTCCDWGDCGGNAMDGLFKCIAGCVNIAVNNVFPPEEPIIDGDESDDESGKADAYRKLKVAIIFSLFFMFVEIVGGILANSLAIVVDAAHMFRMCVGISSHFSQSR